MPSIVSSSLVSVNALKVAVPVGVGIVSLAYLSAKAFGGRNVQTRYESEQVRVKEGFGCDSQQAQMHTFISLLG